MKINGITNNPLNINSEVAKNDKANAGKVEQQGQVIESAVNSSVKAPVNVSVSNIASQFQVIEAKLATVDTFDVKKVDKIKAAIASGEFEVDTDKVASILIETARQLVLSRHTN